MLEKEFIALIREIARSEEFQNLKNYSHHIKGTVYSHSVKVAYLCYRHHKRFGMKTNLGEFVRGALLHDYYLYDAHNKRDPHKFHWVRHPRCALRNAIEKYPNLTDRQKDMIKHHMFPITLIPPTTAAGWIVCFYDKVAAVTDRFGAPHWNLEPTFSKKTKQAVIYNIS